VLVKGVKGREGEDKRNRVGMLKRKMG